MALARRPRFVFNDGSAADITLSLPARPWEYGSQGLGGSDVTASGIPAAFEIRRDYFLHLVLRFDESEWSNVERIVRHLQKGGSATVYPDALQGTTHTVYGHTPAEGEEIRPSRMSEEMSTLELAISLRRSTQAIFTDQYF